MYELLSANPDVAMFISFSRNRQECRKGNVLFEDVIGLQEGTPEYEEYQKCRSTQDTRQRLKGCRGIRK